MPMWFGEAYSSHFPLRDLLTYLGLGFTVCTRHDRHALLIVHTHRPPVDCPGECSPLHTCRLPGLDQNSLHTISTEAVQAHAMEGYRLGYAENEHGRWRHIC